MRSKGWGIRGLLVIGAVALGVEAIPALSPSSFAGPAPWFPAYVKMNDTDKNFLLEAASSGQAEVELAKLGKEKAQSDEVKKLSDHLLGDHGKVNRDLAQLASYRRVPLPGEPQAKHRAPKDTVSKLSGAEFDKQYVRELVKAHEADIAAFQKASGECKDEDLVALVKKTLPVLQRHLTMVREVEAKVAPAAAK